MCSKEVEISKRLGFTGFDLKAKNFVANAYKLFYDAYIKPELEEQQREEQRKAQERYEKSILRPGCSHYPSGLN